MRGYGTSRPAQSCPRRVLTFRGVTRKSTQDAPSVEIGTPDDATVNAPA